MKERSGRCSASISKAILEQYPLLLPDELVGAWPWRKDYKGYPDLTTGERAVQITTPEGYTEFHVPPTPAEIEAGTAVKEKPKYPIFPGTRGERDHIRCRNDHAFGSAACHGSGSLPAGCPGGGRESKEGLPGCGIHSQGHREDHGESELAAGHYLHRQDVLCSISFQQ